MEEEVRRLTDCPECAQIHADLLKLIKRDAESEITRRLAGTLAQLMDARRRQDATEVASLEDQVQKIRAEIEAIDGWFYGRKKVAAVAWPAESVEHQWGNYGQTLCKGCKKHSAPHGPAPRQKWDLWTRGSFLDAPFLQAHLGARSRESHGNATVLESTRSVRRAKGSTCSVCTSLGSPGHSRGRVAHLT